jgi:hypothetical protein
MITLDILIQDTVGRLQTCGRDLQTLAAFYAEAAENHERLADHFLALSAKFSQAATLASADDVAPLLDEFAALCSERVELARRLTAILTLTARA